MKKIWYLNQKSGTKTKTAKAFLYEKNGRIEGRMDLSSFRGKETEEAKNVVLHIKDAGGRTIEEMILEKGTISFDHFFQGKGRLNEGLAVKMMECRGKLELSVIVGKDQYLSEGWVEEETVYGKTVDKNKDKSIRTETEGTGGDGKIEWGNEEKQRGIIEGDDKEEKDAEIEWENENQNKTMEENRGEELSAEELLKEEKGGRRVVKLSVLEEELLFRAYMHNSFLLHGYYNYGHVVIEERDGEARLGVPGNYYEREQMVARMFGFPVFEAAKEGEKIVNGTFGYFYTKG